MKPQPPAASYIESALARLRKEARLVPYEDGLREMVTLGNAVMSVMSAYRRGQRDALTEKRDSEEI